MRAARPSPVRPDAASAQPETASSARLQETATARTHGRTSLALLACTALACGADFTPRSVVTDLRVLAIVASPLEAGPDETVTLAATTIPPPGASVATERWTFCPFSVGSSAGYACAVPACEVELAPGPGGTVSATPGALAAACAVQLGAQGGPPAGVPAQIPDQLTTLFRYVVTSSDGQRRETVQPFTLYTRAAPAVRNHAPVVTQVLIGGQPVQAGDTGPALVPGQTLEFRVTLDPASAEAYTRAAGEALQESLVVSFFTTAGRFDYDRGSGLDESVQLSYDHVDPGTVEARLWAVARDLRGGETVVGPFRVPFGG